MKTVHISQFYPCSRVSLACELYYICELGKYLYYNHESCISLDGVVLDSVLNKADIWDFFRLAVSKGWVTNTGVPESVLEVSPTNPLEADSRKVVNYLFTLDDCGFDNTDFQRRKEDPIYAYTEPYRTRVRMADIHENTKTIGNDSYWLFDLDKLGTKERSDNIRAFGHNLATQLWVSLLAYVATERFCTGNPARFMLMINGDFLGNSGSFSYVFLLSEKTPALEGWCYYTFNEKIPNKTIVQSGYYAWYLCGKDMGLLNKWYSPKDKLKRMEELGIKVDSVVLVYSRDPAKKKNLMKSVNSCIVGIVRGINQVSNQTYSLDIELCHTMKTRHHGKKDFESYVTSVKHLWQGTKPYENFRSSIKKFDLSYLGVEYFMYEEHQFIVPLSGAEDYKDCYVTDGYREDHLILPQNEYIYWVLRDYDVDFDTELFKEQYLNGEEPAYDVYMSGDALDECFYYQEN